MKKLPTVCWNVTGGNDFFPRGENCDLVTWWEEKGAFLKSFTLATVTPHVCNPELLD